MNHVLSKHYEGEKKNELLVIPAMHSSFLFFVRAHAACMQLYVYLAFLVTVKLMSFYTKYLNILNTVFKILRLIYILLSTSVAIKETWYCWFKTIK